MNLQCATIHVLKIQNSFDKIILDGDPLAKCWQGRWDLKFAADLLKMEMLLFVLMSSTLSAQLPTVRQLFLPQFGAVLIRLVTECYPSLGDANEPTLGAFITTEGKRPRPWAPLASVALDPEKETCLESKQKFRNPRNEEFAEYTV